MYCWESSPLQLRLGQVVRLSGWYAELLMSEALSWSLT